VETGNAMEPLLSVKNLRAYLNAKEGPVKIVDGVDLNINTGETVGLVGETGAGKTVTALSILGILQPFWEGKPLWKIEGEVIYKGKNLMELTKEEVSAIRGKEIALITQNPIPSLNPVDIIGYQTGEGVETRKMLEVEDELDQRQRKEIMDLVVEYLGKVEISDAKKRAHHFRHQFSGGEGQRILMAMALVRNPKLLIADEPTSALDVTVQRQILELLKAMKERFKLAMLLITHNLGVIAEMCDYVYVIYAGKILEHGEVTAIFKEPLHPFTRGLIATIPSLDLHAGAFKFEGIPGEPPNPLYPISGCKFHPRCRYAKPTCGEKEPQLTEIKPKHSVACLRIDEIMSSPN